MTGAGDEAMAPETVPYYACEFLAAEPLHEPSTGDNAIGISICGEGPRGDQVGLDFTLSLIDSCKLVMQLLLAQGACGDDFALRVAGYIHREGLLEGRQ